jgi:hypothetical protein
VVLAQRSPHLGTDRHAAATIGVVRLDVDGDDTRQSDQAAGTDTSGQLVLVEEAAHPAIQQEEDERATEHERCPLHLDRDLVEGEDRGDERRHGERQEDERATEERQLDEGEHDRQREPDPWPDVEIDAEVEHPVGEHIRNITKADDRWVCRGRNGPLNTHRLAGCGEITRRTPGSATGGARRRPGGPIRQR